MSFTKKKVFHLTKNDEFEMFIENFDFFKETPNNSLVFKNYKRFIEIYNLKIKLYQWTKRPLIKAFLNKQIKICENIINNKNLISINYKINSFPRKRPINKKFFKWKS